MFLYKPFQKGEIIHHKRNIDTEWIIQLHCQKCNLNHHLHHVQQTICSPKRQLKWRILNHLYDIRKNNLTFTGKVQVIEKVTANHPSQYWLEREDFLFQKLTQKFPEALTKMIKCQIVKSIVPSNFLVGIFQDLSTLTDFNWIVSMVKRDLTDTCTIKDSSQSLTGLWVKV